MNAHRPLQHHHGRLTKRRGQFFVPDLESYETRYNIYIQSIIHVFVYLTELLILTDPRTKDWFLVDNFGLLVVVSTAYVGVVLFGPKLMQNVKPFSLKRVIQVYNLMMIVVNAYIFQQVCV
jgi:hypothetical protein